MSVNHITAEGTYDDNFIYEKFSEKYPDAEIVIPPKSGSIYNAKNHYIRNQHVLVTKEMSRQQNEGMIGCGILNKMTSLGMPKSYRYA